MNQWFKGIDLANGQQNVGECWLEIDNKRLVAHFTGSDENVDLTGIDCPFGTSLGFYHLLQGKEPSYQSDDDYQTRQTERWLREHLWKFKTNEFWRQQKQASGLYVNKTGHVQATLRITMVPCLLNWIRTRVDSKTFSQSLINARQGEGPYIESHPRAYLYSVVEQILLNDLSEEAIIKLRAVVEYKDKDRISHQNERLVTYRLLQQNTGKWLPDGYCLPESPPEELLETDHAFDAWLSALTAFTHDHGMTVTWKDADIAEANVKVEGHILILNRKVHAHGVNHE